MSEEVGFRCIVSGKVQGVFFRASTAREAARLGISGHAINLPDGRVEVLAFGSAGALEEFRRWLARGPPLARVDRIECRSQPVAGTPSGFLTG